MRRLLLILAMALGVVAAPAFAGQTYYSIFNSGYGPSYYQTYGGSTPQSACAAAAAWDSSVNSVSAVCTDANTSSFTVTEHWGWRADTVMSGSFNTFSCGANMVFDDGSHTCVPACPSGQSLNSSGVCAPTNDCQAAQGSTIGSSTNFYSTSDGSHVCINQCQTSSAGTIQDPKNGLVAWGPFTVTGDTCSVNDVPVASPSVTCWDGSTASSTANCPTSQLCPDGSHIATSATCPSGTGDGSGSTGGNGTGTGTGGNTGTGTGTGTGSGTGSGSGSGAGNGTGQGSGTGSGTGNGSLNCGTSGLPPCDVNVHEDATAWGNALASVSSAYAQLSQFVDAIMGKLDGVKTSGDPAGLGIDGMTKFDPSAVVKPDMAPDGVIPDTGNCQPLQIPFFGSSTTLNFCGFADEMRPIINFFFAALTAIYVYARVFRRTQAQPEAD